MMRRSLCLPLLFCTSSSSRAAGAHTGLTPEIEADAQKTRDKITTQSPETRTHTRDRKAASRLFDFPDVVIHSPWSCLDRDEGCGMACSFPREAKQKEDIAAQPRRRTGERLWTLTADSSWREDQRRSRMQARVFI